MSYSVTELLKHHIGVSSEIFAVLWISMQFDGVLAIVRS